MTAIKFSYLPLESQLILCCARTRFLPDHAARVADLVSEKIHWQRVIQLAKLHGVSPLVSKNLAKVDSPQIPGEYLESLRHYTRACALLNQFLAEELVDLVEAFRAQNIIVVPFKGPTLACFAYGDLKLREFGDLDLFVRQKDLLIAREIVLSKGYQDKIGNSNPSDSELLEERFWHTFVKGNGMSSVDLQWIMAGDHFSFLLDRQIFWENLGEVQVNGKTVLNFTPENLLIILCVHGTKHVWESLKWICDVSELMVSCPELDWELVGARSSQLHYRRAVHFGVYLAHWYFDVPLPNVLERDILADPDFPPLAMMVPNYLLENPRSGVQEKYCQGAYLLLKDSCKDKWKYCWELCKTENSVVHAHLPWFYLQKRLRVLFLLAYPWRFFRENILIPKSWQKNWSRLANSFFKGAQ